MAWSTKDSSLKTQHTVENSVKTSNLGLTIGETKNICFQITYCFTIKLIPPNNKTFVLISENKTLHNPSYLFFVFFLFLRLESQHPDRRWWVNSSRISSKILEINRTSQQIRLPMTGTTWGQFHLPNGAKRKCAASHSSAPLVIFCAIQFHQQK